MSERKVTVAALQASYGHDMAANIAKTAELVREAAKQGARDRAAAGAVPEHLLPDAAGPEMVRDRSSAAASTLP